MNFTVLKNAVAKQFATLAKGTLYRTAATGDEMWETYLKSFPEGSNPVHRERTEHDCNCCKQFIRAVGNVVGIVDGKVQSIWDISIPKEPEYQIVADALAALVKRNPIANLFLHYETKAGSDKSYEDTVNGVKTWDHFFVNIPSKFVMHKDNIASTLGDNRASFDVALRGLS